MVSSYGCGWSVREGKGKASTKRERLREMRVWRMMPENKGSKVEESSEPENMESIRDEKKICKLEGIGDKCWNPFGNNLKVE